MEAIPLEILLTLLAAAPKKDTRTVLNTVRLACLPDGAILVEETDGKQLWRWQSDAVSGKHDWEPAEFCPPEGFDPLPPGCQVLLHVDSLPMLKALAKTAQTSQPAIPSFVGVFVPSDWAKQAPEAHAVGAKYQTELNAYLDRVKAWRTANDVGEKEHVDDYPELKASRDAACGECPERPKLLDEFKKTPAQACIAFHQPVGDRGLCLRSEPGDGRYPDADVILTPLSKRPVFSRIRLNVGNLENVIKVAKALSDRKEPSLALMLGFRQGVSPIRAEIEHECGLVRGVIMPVKETRPNEPMESALNDLEAARNAVAFLREVYRSKLIFPTTEADKMLYPNTAELGDLFLSGLDAIETALDGVAPEPDETASGDSDPDGDHANEDLKCDSTCAEQEGAQQ